MDNNNIRSQYPLPPIESTGLPNPENNCYINAAIQCLSHTVPLWERLSGDRHFKDDCSVKDCLMCCLWKLMNVPLGANGSVQLILDKLKDFSKSLERNAHQDVHKFLTSVFAKFWTQFQEVFEGRLTSERMCQSCGASIASVDSFNTLMLNVLGVASLCDALSSYMNGDDLLDTNCIFCHSDNSKEKHEIRLLPPIVVLMMKRFINEQGDIQKYDAHVEFPLDIDFGQYMTTGRQEYSLYAFIEHYGTSENGHYNAYIRFGASTWYEFNNSLVTQMLESDVLQRKPYLLFYSSFGTHLYGEFLARKNQPRQPHENKGSGVPQPVKDDGESALRISFPPAKTYSVEERRILVLAMRKSYRKWVAVKKEFFAKSPRSVMSLKAQWQVMIRLAMDDNDKSAKKRMDFIPDEVARDVLSMEVSRRHGNLVLRGEMKKRLAVLTALG